MHKAKEIRCLGWRLELKLDASRCGWLRLQGSWSRWYHQSPMRRKKLASCDWGNASSGLARMIVMVVLVVFSGSDLFGIDLYSLYTVY